MSSDLRSSRPGATEKPPALSADGIARVEARNGLRQVDRMVAIIDDAVKAGGEFRLRPSMISELNRLAVQDLVDLPGAIRQFPVSISNSVHSPPPWEEVAGHIEDLCDYVSDHWASSPVHLSSYVLWKLNWIHPFGDGNGRTSRVVSYIVLCTRLGYLVPGKPTVPELIALDKNPYYSALDDADAHWRNGIVNIDKMEEVVSARLAKQLHLVYEMATKA